MSLVFQNLKIRSLLFIYYSDLFSIHMIVLGERNVAEKCATQRLVATPVKPFRRLSAAAPGEWPLSGLVLDGRHHYRQYVNKEDGTLHRNVSFESE